MSTHHGEHIEQTSSNRTRTDTSMRDRRGDGEAFAGAGGHVPRSDNPVDPTVLETALGDALRADALDPQAERHAVAAFRAAREAGVHKDARTRGRDDWRARRGSLRRGMKAAVALFGASLTLGGVAIAAIGSPDGTRAPQDQASGPRHPSPTARQPSSPMPRTDRPDKPAEPAEPAEPRTSVAAERPPTAKDVQAHCRAYASVKDRGKALESTAWQRFIATAGGEDNVAAFCADLLARTEADNPGKAKGKGNPKSAGRTPEQTGPQGKGPQGRGPQGRGPQGTP
ncbi:hypothetical protein [Streptomyces sp. NPDC001020]